MKGQKVTLVAATATLLARAGAGSDVLLQTALTDLFLGENNTITSAGANSCAYGTIAGITNLGALEGDLWGISAAGGVVGVLQNE